MDPDPLVPERSYGGTEGPEGGAALIRKDPCKKWRRVESRTPVPLPGSKSGTRFPYGRVPWVSGVRNGNEKPLETTGPHRTKTTSRPDPEVSTTRVEGKV